MATVVCRPQDKLCLPLLQNNLSALGHHCECVIIVINVRAGKRKCQDREKREFNEEIYNAMKIFYVLF